MPCMSAILGMDELKFVIFVWAHHIPKVFWTRGILLKTAKHVFFHGIKHMYAQLHIATTPILYQSAKFMSLPILPVIRYGMM